MLRYPLLTLFFLIGHFSIAQSVKKEKHAIKYHQVPFVKLKTPLTSYSSNSDFLKISGSIPTQSGSYKLSGEIYDPIIQKNSWGEETEYTTVGDRTAFIMASQPIKIKVTDSAGEVIYFRIFNTPEQHNPTFFKNEKPSDVLGYSDLSKHLSYLFEDKVASVNLKLFYVAKSDQHEDVNLGYKKAVEAISAGNKSDFEKSSALLHEATDIWTKALEEADVNNKKSRINKKVADGIYKNLIQVLPFVGKYDEARNLISEYRTNIGGFGVVFAEAQEPLIRLMENNAMATKKSGQASFKDVEIMKNPPALNQIRRI